MILSVLLVKRRVVSDVTPLESFLKELNTETDEWIKDEMTVVKQGYMATALESSEGGVYALSNYGGHLEPCLEGAAPRPKPRPPPQAAAERHVAVPLRRAEGPHERCPKPNHRTILVSPVQLDLQLRFDF